MYVPVALTTVPCRRSAEPQLLGADGALLAENVARILPPVFRFSDDSSLAKGCRRGPFESAFAQLFDPGGIVRLAAMAQETVHFDAAR